MNKHKLFILACLLAGAAQSQTCFSPGTGVDGAFSASSNTTLAGGTYNFTTFNIDPGVLVSVTGGAPLKIYCMAAATINGTLSVDGGNGSDGVTFANGGNGGIGVAGGSNGGNGSFSSNNGPIIGAAGIGAGGIGNQGDDWSGGGGAGYANTGGGSGSGTGGIGGPQYGNISVITLDPGSGGGGGSGGYDCGAGGGGAGGGVIVFNSGVSITIGAGGAIMSNGGNGGSDGTGNCGGGGGGSGGTIWLAANLITNNGLISAVGGLGGASAVAGSPYYGEGGSGSDGRIRLDVNTNSGSGVISPAPGITYPAALDPLTVVVTVTNTCANGNAGAAVATASNGAGNYTYLWMPGNITTPNLSNLSPGTYTYVITDAGLCTITNTIAVVSNPNPTVTIAPSTSSICMGEAATLVASGALTYSWSTQDPNPTITVSPTITTSYSVTGTDVNGCISSTMQSISVNALPSVSLTASNNTVCSSAASGGSTITLTGSPANGVYSGSNLSGNLFPPTTPGTYTAAYSYTDAATGCSKTASTTLIVSFCTGITDNSGPTLRLSVYPNPNNGFFKVDVSEGSHLQITNSLGQLLFDRTIDAGEQTIDLSTQPKGLYFVSVKTGNKIYIEKIIKE